MPYNEQIDVRIGKIVSKWNNMDRKKMFGGTCYLQNGNMVAGVYKDFMILRLGEDGASQALQQPHTKPFDITGKPMKGWVMVEEDGFKDNEALNKWLNQAREFVKTLPSK